ncbi:MAG: undecaprenyl-diphosphate phosphatase [FCB group bacterium]|nr:undecaprenyl-diphosphate phosphatase [FCB group bacterium]
MNAIDAIILGIIQGLTEFLPVSSSGHLVIGETLLGLDTPGISLEVWLHVGTLVAVVGYFHRRITALVRSIFSSESEELLENRKLWKALIIGTLPAIVVGISLKAMIESTFDSPVLASGMLLVTGTMLLLTPLAQNKLRAIDHSRGFFIGLAQAVAILPGISRSGSTIACAMFLGIKPALAAEFSFLLAVPAIIGAFLLDFVTSGEKLFEAATLPLFLLGAAVSFIFGLLSIHYLLKLIKKGKLFYFGFYCLVVGGLGLVYLT